MEKTEIERNIQHVLSRIDAVTAGAKSKVRIVAATKTVPPESVSVALDCGIIDIGENRVQEYLIKRDGVSGAQWHFIGTLQTNKAKYLVGNIALIQSVNSLSLAREIDRLAKNRGVVQDVLVEVNVAGESSKTGAAADSAEELCSHVDGLDGVRLCGLMSVPPRDAGDNVYRDIRNLYERLARGRQYFEILSVGMSNDYERAVAFGSNMVRIGTAIFGRRN